MNVDAVIRAKITTWDPARPSASAMAVHHGRIVAFDDDAEELARDAKCREEYDGYLFPGFHDAHCHTTAFGLSLSELDLSTPPITNLEHLYLAVEVRARATPPGEWVIGYGYDQNKIGGRHPELRKLDEVGLGHPVWLKHTSAHMCVINSAAADQLDLPRTVPGGRVVFDDEGKFTGLLEERAQVLVQQVVLPRSLDTLATAIGRAHERYLSEGITSVCDAGVAGGWIGQSPVEIAAYQLARDRGLLKVRTTLMLSIDALREIRGHRDDGLERALGLPGGIRTGFGDDWLRIGPVKVFSDGSLIGRTCWMEDGFEDDSENTGYPQADPEDLRNAIVGAHLGGWQVATHAIGDKAVRFVIDCYEDALTQQPRNDHRHRIEHCGITSDDSLARIARLGIVPVPQGRFVGEIGDGMLAALGPERAAHAYRLRSFINAGVILPGSSDRPVVTGRPLLGVMDMVCRLTESERPFGSAEAITVEEAMNAYSVGSAQAEHTESSRGSLKVGQLADFVVLVDDPRRLPPREIGPTPVVFTSCPPSEGLRRQRELGESGA
jgi:predicted amidohydrolase YtcJ